MALRKFARDYEEQVWLIGELCYGVCIVESELTGSEHAVLTDKLPVVKVEGDVGYTLYYLKGDDTPFKASELHRLTVDATREYKRINREIDGASRENFKRTGKWRPAGCGQA